MNGEHSFEFIYNAQENQEVLAIRDKYLPRAETKLEELKRLDHTVQSAGVVEALIIGILSSLIFGVGFCLCLKVLAGGWMLGILLGIVGSAGMISAYPVHRKLVQKNKEKYTPRILELTTELTEGR